jgi:VWFA-related protein
VNALEKVRIAASRSSTSPRGHDFNPFAKTRAGEDLLSQTSGRTTQNAGQDTSQQQNTGSGSSADPWAKSGGEWADADLAAQLSDLTRAATRANVAFYTIDPRGLASGMPDLDENLDMSEWMNYIQKSTDSLRVLAEQTGGVAVVSQNDFTKALNRIDAETSDYYVLGYYSSNPIHCAACARSRSTSRGSTSPCSASYYTLRRPGRAR